MAVQLIILSFIVQLVSSKPIIIDTSNTTTVENINASTPMPLLVKCRPGTYIKRDCKFYIDCHRGHWRRNFCPVHKAWNHEIKMCDDLQNVPECMAILLDMKHSPIKPLEETNQLTDEIRTDNSDKRKSVSKKPKHKTSAKEVDEEMVIEENIFIDKKPNKSSADKSESKVNTDSKQKATEVIHP